MSSRKEQKAAARQARIAAETDARRSEERDRRLRLLLGVLVAAAVVVGVAIAVSSGGSSAPKPVKKQTGEKVAGQHLARALLDGIPQRGVTLGRSNAPLTLVEFADLQCPVCRDYTLNYEPRIVHDLVRTGKLKIELRLIAILGSDSEAAQKYAAATTPQNRLWYFADLFYLNQKEENTGYVTPAFMRTIASGVPGLNLTALQRATQDSAATSTVGVANTLEDRYAVDATPTFLLGKNDESLHAVSSDYTQLEQTINSELSQ